MTKFFYLTFSTLVLLGVWQVIHLRSYFKKSASASRSSCLARPGRLLDAASPGRSYCAALR